LLILIFFSSALVSRVKELCTFADPVEAVRIISGLRWIGLFSDEALVPRADNLLDTLCARLETLMAYAPGERDLVMLQHKFVVERADGTEVGHCRKKAWPVILAPGVKLTLECDSKSSRRRSRRTVLHTDIRQWPSPWAYLAALLHSWSLMASSPPQAYWYPTPKKYVTLSARS
jgi:Saccharopine dehydrogenase C-terminal domain